MAMAESRGGGLAKKHHEQSKFCYKRPAYREAKWERAVKVYTINQESKYLLVQGVPSVGVRKELIELFAIYGAIEEYRYLDEYPSEEFTDVYWIKFQKIQAARYAKKKLDMRSFYGGILHVCYAPEYETVDDTRQKLIERRKIVAKKCREYYPEQEALSHEKIDRRLKSTDESLQSVTSSQEPHTVPESYQEPRTLSVSAGSHYSISPQANASFPQLPLPPVHLPPSLLPLPQHAMALEHPRVPTKNATLPKELQNSVYPNKTIQGNSLTSSVKHVEQRHQSPQKEVSVGGKRRLESPTSFGSDKSRREKRIVWHQQPGASTSITTGLSELRPPPGAWDPFAESRKQHKSLTGDQNLDDVALRIREKLKKATDFESATMDRDAKDHSAGAQQKMEPQKKARKRI